MLFCIESIKIQISEFAVRLRTAGLRHPLQIFFRRNEHMKKIIALLLAVVMVFALVACASTAKPEEKTE